MTCRWRALCATFLIATAASAAMVCGAAAQSGMRCGWFSNPTPANASLYDKDGEWIVAVQGGHQADGDWPPNFASSQWVKFGPGSYGYGCACMTVAIDPSRKYVTAIVSAKARPLATCRKDPALAGVERKFQ